MSPNPFSQKAGVSTPSPTKSGSKAGTKKIRRSVTRPQRSSDGSMSTPSTKANPWSSIARSTTKPSTKPSSTAGRKRSTSASRGRTASRPQPSYTIVPVPTGPDVSGVSVGDRVRITWEVDRAYATPGSGEFVGVVTALDDWITATNAGVKFHYPLSTLANVERVEHKPKRVKIRRG